MKQRNHLGQARPFLRSLAVLAAGLVLSLTQSGCLMVGGYSSRGGWFLWPGSFGLILIVLLVLFLLRRGR